MTLTIKSRKLGIDFEFMVFLGGECVRLWHGGKWRQICKGGGFTGSALTATNEYQFKKACRAWYRAHLKNEALA